MQLKRRVGGAQFGELAGSFLDAVLAETVLSASDRGLHGGGIMRLGDRNEGDGAGSPARPFGGGGNVPLDGGQAFGKGRAGCGGAHGS